MLLTQGAVAGFLVFTLGWVVSGLMQIDAYSWTTHDISDLGAQTANRPWIMLGGCAFAGVMTIGFAILVLRPLLDVPGKRGSIGPWLLAASLPGLDNVSDVFFRLNCMAAEPGCTEAVRTASGAAKIHMLVGLVTALITVATPFVLARRVRMVPATRALFVPCIVVGSLLLIGLVFYVALENKWGQGIAQRAMAVLASGGVAALALFVLRIDSRRPRT